MKWPPKKPVLYGNTKLCFALQKKAFRIWKMRRHFLKVGKLDMADNCLILACEAAREADEIAAKSGS